MSELRKELHCLFGLGDGSVYEEVKGDQHMVFLEPEAQVIEKMTNHPLFSDPKVEVHHIGEDEGDLPLYRSLAHRFLGEKMRVEVLPGYRPDAKDFFVEVWEHVHQLNLEYLDYGQAFFQNFYANIRSLNDSYWGGALFGKFENVPAVICGAGPSLDKQFDRLHDMQDRALIFAAGSAMAVMPSHLGGALDPNSCQRDRLLCADDFERPIFYRLRLHREALMSIHGPRLYANGAGGYPVVEWLEKQVGIPHAEINAGYNVVNFLTDIAHKMGCSPIIYVGMDLSFRKEASHAAGLPVEEDLDSILVKDIYGRDVYTSAKWQREAQWIGEYKEAHRVNATEGGIGMPGVVNMRLCDADMLYCDKRHDFRAQIHGHLQGSKLNVSIDRAIAELDASLERSIEHLRKLPDPLAEFELHEEVAYQNILKVLEGAKSDPDFLIEAARLNREWIHG